MSSKYDSTVILLKYKGKILLMLKGNHPVYANTKPWEFIETNKKAHKSLEESIIQKVEEETNMKLAKIQLVSSQQHNLRNTYFYQAALTDDNVNAINRKGDQSLDFYSFKDMENLPFTETTQLFIDLHKELLKTVSN